MLLLSGQIFGVFIIITVIVKVIIRIFLAKKKKQINRLFLVINNKQKDYLIVC